MSYFIKNFHSQAQILICITLIVCCSSYEGMPDVSKITDDDENGGYMESVIYRECSQPGMIALTYDDGPNIFTEEFINNLTNDYPVTLYINGWNYKQLQNSPWHSIIKLAYDKGHEIGNHGWNHWSYTNAAKANKEKLKRNLSNTEVLEQLIKTNDLIYAIIGKAPAIFRPPYGQFDQSTLRIASVAGLDYMALWNVDSLDWEYKDAPSAFDAIMKIIMSPGVSPLNSSFVIVMHEQIEHSMLLTTPFLSVILQDLGYRLVTMSECMGLVSAYQENYIPLKNMTLYNGSNHNLHSFILSFTLVFLSIISFYW